MAAGTWRGSPPDVGSVRVACPGCKVSYYLDHEVAADGTVSPSLDCPTTGCNFHERVKLEGWTP